MNSTEKEGILRKICCQEREEELVVVAELLFFCLNSFQFSFNGFT